MTLPPIAITFCPARFLRDTRLAVRTHCEYRWRNIKVNNHPPRLAGGGYNDPATEGTFSEMRLRTLHARHGRREARVFCTLARPRA